MEFGPVSPLSKRRFQDKDTPFVGKNQSYGYLRTMLGRIHTLMITGCLLLCTALCGQEFSAGLFMSPKGAGITAQWDYPRRGEMDVLTLRNDLYGILSGRTTLQGASLCFTHEYVFYERGEEDLHLRLHAGAGGMLGYVQDFEQGFFSAYDRELKHSPGGVAALAGRIGLRVDFYWNRLSIDISCTAAPGIHLRSDRDSGAMILSFYRNGLLFAFTPELNLLYNF